MTDRNTTEAEEFFLVDAPYATIKVSNFVDASKEALTEFFSYCGFITKVDVGENEATLQFRDVESAKSAVMLSGSTVGNSKIVVEPVPEVGVEEALAWSTALTASDVPSSTPTQTSVVDSLLAAGYELAEQTRQKAMDYDKQYAVSTSVEDAANQISATVNEIDGHYNISGAAQEGLDNLGRKIQEFENEHHVGSSINKAIEDFDKEYQVGASLNQAVAAAKNTGELAIDVLVAKTQETVAGLPEMGQIKEQGETMTMNAVTAAAQAIESLELQQKGEAVLTSISDFVQTNETAQSAWANVVNWAASAHTAIVGDTGRTEQPQSP